MVIKQKNTEPKVKQINSSTQIVFTVKAFLTTIGTILGIFYGFYRMVIIPRVELTESNYEKMFKDQKEQNTIFYGELNKINNSIGALNSTINALNKNGTPVHNDIVQNS